MSKSASPTHPTQTSPRRSTGEKHSSGGKPQSDDRHATRGGHVPASTVSTSIPRVNTISTPTANGHTERERPNGRAKRGDRVEPKAAPEDPYPGLRALLRRTQDDLANITSDLDASNEAVRRLSDDRRAVEDLQRELKQAKQTISERDREIAHLQREKKDVAELLERRTVELNAAQAFFPAAETVTDVQVIEQVKDLNYEIVQVATALVELYDGEPRVLRTADVLQACSSYLRGVIDDTCLHLLIPAQDGKNKANFQTWFQIGIQSCISHHVRSIAEQWYLGPREKTRAFDCVWDTLHKEEPVTVAIKWSALTRKHARRAFDGNNAEHNVVQLIAQQVTYIAVLAGYESAANDSSKANALVLSKVERQITEVARLAIRFNETIGQKIPSCIMQPLLFAPGTDFDASTMTSEFNEGRDVGERAEARVICTTALGLRRAAEGVDQVLVKPQVVLRVDSPRQGHTS